MWVVDATNIRTGGMSTYIYGVGPKREVRRIPSGTKVDIVAGERDRNKEYRGESRSGGLLHPWQGSDFDQMA